MQVLVVGSGGREHALAWKLSQSPQITKVYCAPGNAGMQLMPKCRLLPLAVTDVDGMIRFVTVQGIGLTVVGPEVPLIGGIVDQFMAAGIPIFGPTRDAAQLEGSKAWAKGVLQEAGVPTADYQVFQQSSEALAYLETCLFPIVVKADGVAAGKGVTVATSLAEAQQAVRSLFQGSLGDAGKTVVIETFLEGEEVSVLAFCDGSTYRVMPPVQDHKRIGIGDTGPNTGGMGAYAPATRVVPPDVMTRIQATVFEPTLATLRQRGITYKGVLYAGLMITPAREPQVLEFNCRFGDPETQVLMPLLETPLEQVLQACVQGSLSELEVEWSTDHAACVVMASRGYPDNSERGQVISGLKTAAETGAILFHAGTRLSGNQSVYGQSLEGQSVLTNGGRVLAATGVGSSLPAALTQAYQGIQAIEFDGSYYRTDIGYREVGEAVLEHDN